MFPRLVGFVTNAEPEDPEQARSLIAHALCQYVASVDPGRATAAMSVVIPTLLTRANAEGEELYGEVSARLLELAAVHQASFRAIVGGLSGPQRSFLEEVIRSGRDTSGGSERAGTDGTGQPSITLKMNFGG